MKSTMELLLLLVLFVPQVKGSGYTPPGTPKLTSCRSPEKETFTCWWEPGSDGGLPTTHTLYYRKENSETVYECPDYHTAGENSCFFNKNDTSIWVNYNITVVATNALGSNFSDPVDVDVVYIVQPHTPENVTVGVMEDKDGPFLRASWEPPHKADTRSGWITLIYELRVKLQGEEEWVEHRAGQQKMFNIFSLRSGGTYLVQVRCKPDHGFWSEWSPTTPIKVPDYFPREKSLWILITVFSAFISLILTWILHMNSRSMKNCLLPPVPGPKIKGFDNQLLKNGKSDEVFSALVVPAFPPPTSSNYEDLLVEYLEVYVSEEQELMLKESKDLHEGNFKAHSSPSDSDSGHGSCDSRTLLLEKFGEDKEEQSQKEEEGNQKRLQTPHTMWREGGVVSRQHEEAACPAMDDGRVKTWPSVFSPLPQYSSRPLVQLSSVHKTKQHCLSDTLFPPAPTSSLLSPSTKDALGPNHWELHPQTQPHQQLQAYSYINISNIGRKPAVAGVQWTAFHPTEYAAVQRVNDKDVVVLQPVVSGRPQVSEEEDYSKVKAVDSSNMLLLQRDVVLMQEEPDRWYQEDQETRRGTDSCFTTANQKPTSCVLSEAAVQRGASATVSGYVDTATAFTLPIV
ncbi:prolactin receptor a [Genypterus blacodes]|uniref:prolactin receptor a n=1 Tax=Genypterus blacodes TaxID=154954 RepID=UPI003F775B4C